MKNNSEPEEVEPSHLQKVQNAVPPVYTGEHPRGRLSHVNRPEGGIPPCADLANPPAILPVHYMGRHYQYQALPFGLSSVPRTFTKLLATHFQTLPMCVQCYLDDILIQSSGPRHNLGLPGPWIFDQHRQEPPVSPQPFAAPGSSHRHKFVQGLSIY